MTTYARKYANSNDVRDKGNSKTNRVSGAFYPSALHSRQDYSRQMRQKVSCEFRKVYRLPELRLNGRIDKNYKKGVKL